MPVKTDVTLANITDDEVTFITSQDNQRLWAVLNINHRCILFHRQFTSRRIKRGVMLKVMKQAGLRLKKIEVSNIPAKKEQRVQEFEAKTIALD